jgi:ribonuclease HI
VVVALNPQTMSEAEFASGLFVKAIYTDGACSGNPGPGGWGVIVELSNGQRQELGGREGQTTNNRMELQAAIEAIKCLEDLVEQTFGLSVKGCVYTDSEYVKNGITKWLSNWKKRGWKTAQGKPVLNQDLWETLDALNPNRLEWQYIKAHAGHPGNERADEIARAFSLRRDPNLVNLNDCVVGYGDDRRVGVGEVKVISVSSLDSEDPSESKDDELRFLAAQRLIMSLQHVDSIASHGFLITDSELAELIDSDLSAILDREDKWDWRNWRISRVREEEGRTLWQIERVHSTST